MEERLDSLYSGQHVNSDLRSDFLASLCLHLVAQRRQRRTRVGNGTTVEVALRCAHFVSQACSRADSLDEDCEFGK
jgi:hypothetical protein